MGATKKQKDSLLNVVDSGKWKHSLQVWVDFSRRKRLVSWLRSPSLKRVLQNKNLVFHKR
jgi:hypothetical protein